jgi:hypothetical protein
LHLASGALFTAWRSLGDDRLRNHFASSSALNCLAGIRDPMVPRNQISIASSRFFTSLRATTG